MMKKLTRECTHCHPRTRGQAACIDRTSGVPRARASASARNTNGELLRPPWRKLRPVQALQGLNMAVDFIVDWLTRRPSPTPGTTAHLTSERGGLPGQRTCIKPIFCKPTSNSAAHELAKRCLCKIDYLVPVCNVNFKEVLDIRN